MKLLFLGCLFFLLAPAHTRAQVADSLAQQKSSADSIKALHNKNIYRTLEDSNIFLNTRGLPQALPEQQKKEDGRQVFFYVIAGLFLQLGIMKTLYSRYFSTLFRVFFNTSLRQNQLTDQLEQAKLPSFVFNVFFVLVAGLYIYFLFAHFHPGKQQPDWYLAGLCVLAVGACYFMKYISLRFTGWLTNCRAEASTYIFIIFLLNKVMGILLLPFLALLAFSTPVLASYSVFISLLLLALIFITRFFRSYSLLQNRLRITAFHFLLYIIALEILPIALIYKGVTLFLSINS